MATIWRRTQVKLTNAGKAVQRFRARLAAAVPRVPLLPNGLVASAWALVLIVGGCLLNVAPMPVSAAVIPPSCMPLSSSFNKIQCQSELQDKVYGTSDACPGIDGSTTVSVPPKGYASYVEIVVNGDCSVTVTSPAQVLAPTPYVDSGVNLGASVTKPLVPLGPIMPRGAQAAALGAVDASKATYVVQREWDCCGVVMNQSVTNMSWTQDGTYVDFANDQDNAEYHRETYDDCSEPGGWDLHGHSAQWIDTAGGTYTHLEVESYFAYSYLGKFDCSGSQYYNEFWNYMTVNGDGGATAAVHWNLRNTFKGWHAQAWAAWGTYSDG